MQLDAVSSYHHNELGGKKEEEQLYQCSECKGLENIQCVFVLLITWDGVLMVLLVSHAEFIKYPSRYRFSVLWVMLLFPFQPHDTIQGCPQSGLQVW